MSSGSWLDDGLETIGNKPGHMGAWEKFQLGWLKYEVATRRPVVVHKLGPMEYNTKQAQGCRDPSQKLISSLIGDPFEGSYFYFSGSANNLDNRMTKAFTLPAGATLTAKVNFGIEGELRLCCRDHPRPMVAPPGRRCPPTCRTQAWSRMHRGVLRRLGRSDCGLVCVPPNVRWLQVQERRVGSTTTVHGRQFAVSGAPLDGAESDAGWTFAGFA